MSPSWEPYSPQMRLQNLRMIKSKFQIALARDQLCVQPDGGGSHLHPLRWQWKDAEGDAITPERMGEGEFTEQVSLMFDGLREGHEPWRHLATQASLAFLATGSPHLVAAASRLAKPLRLGLQTYEPHLVGHAVDMLKRWAGGVFTQHAETIMMVDWMMNCGSPERLNIWNQPSKHCGLPAITG